MPMNSEPGLEQVEGAEKIALSRKSRALSMISTMPGMHGTMQWEAIMRKFHESSKIHCKATPQSIPVVTRSKKDFPTGSSYEGSWNLFGMSGSGTYVFPQTGVQYVGGFSDGMFNGEGELQYDCGATIKGKWHKGVIQEKTLMFADGLEYNENRWMYCTYPDRRYTVEYDYGMQPAGRSYITAEQPPPEIPEGFFDVGDGFYEPATKTVYKYDDLTSIVRSPTVREQKWILENCRRSPDVPLGPMPFLYEEWKTPDLEKEDTPPPAARTKLTQEEDEREREEQELTFLEFQEEWKKRESRPFADQDELIIFPDFEPRSKALQKLQDIRPSSLKKCSSLSKQSLTKSGSSLNKSRSKSRSLLGKSESSLNKSTTTVESESLLLLSKNNPKATQSTVNLRQTINKRRILS